MTPKDYSDHYLKQFNRYIKQVQNKTLVVGELEYLAVNRWSNLYTKKYYFNEQEFEKRLKFCSLINVKSVIDKGQVVQLKLANWQLLTLAHYSLYQNKKSDNKVIQTISLSFSGKSGKSSLAVIIALMACLIDNRINANIPIICISQKQANQALDYFKQIIKASPAIQPFFKILHSTIIYSDKNTTNKIFILTNDSDKVQALEIAIGIVDEIYLFDREESTVIDVIRSKQSTTFNPVTFVIGTFSDKEKHNFDNYYIPCTNILNGIVEDDSHFILFCSQDNEDEINDPSTWSKSNPSLGIVKTLDSLIQAYERTKIFPASLNTFKTENLNMWNEVVSENRFLTDALVNNAMRETEPIVLGSSIVIGLDLSSNTDVYSISIMSTEQDSSSPVGVGFKFNTINIIPNVQQNFIKGDIDLTKWFVQNLKKYKDNGYQPDSKYNPKGYIIPSTLPVLDTDLVYDLIIDLSNKYKIEAIAYDSYNSGQIVYKLINEGLNCVIAEQGIKVQNEPLKLIERLISLDHFNSGSTNTFQICPNPFVKWQARNLKLYIDSNENYKLIKRTRKGIPLSIDSWSAMLNCMVYWWLTNKDNLSGKGFALEQFKQLG